MESIPNTLEDYVQLHEDITIWYIVEGYQALYNVQDGNYTVLTIKANSIELALKELLIQLQQKTLAEWRKTTSNLEIDIIKGV